MKIYISGPMTGIENYNREAFALTAKVITDRGDIAINPHDVGDTLPSGSTWQEYMKADIKALMDAEAIYMLDGWQDSKGATIERNLALSVGIKELK